jgi:hypothetical protein
MPRFGGQEEGCLQQLILEVNIRSQRQQLSHLHAAAMKCRKRGGREVRLCAGALDESTEYRAGGFSGLVLWMWLGLVVSPSECCQERLRAAAARRGHRQTRDHARDLAQGCMPRRRAASADQAQPQEVLA